MWNQTEKKSIFKALPVIRSCRPGEHFLLSGVIDRTSTSCYQELQTGRALPVIRSCRPGEHFLLSGVVDLVTTYCLPLHYICLGCPQDCSPCHTIFCKTSKLSYYFYIVKRYVTFIYCFVFLYNTQVYQIHCQPAYQVI